MAWLFLSAAAAGGPIPAPVRDGGVLAADGPVVLRVGGGPGAGPPEDGVVSIVLGDAVPRGSARRWREVAARTEGPTLFVPGAGEHRGDRELRAFTRAVDGLGVAGLSEPVPWRAFTVESAGTAWRVVLVDAAAEALGARWRDELAWLPKVARGPVVVLASRGFDTGAPRDLAEVAGRTADPLVAVVVPGPAAALLPGGRWGAAWLATGPSTRLTFDGRALRVSQPGLLDQIWTADGGWRFVPPGSAP